MYGTMNNGTTNQPNFDMYNGVGGTMQGSQEPINPFMNGTPSLGYRTTPMFVPVDFWEPTRDSERVFMTTKGFIIAPISKFYTRGQNVSDGNPNELKVYFDPNDEPTPSDMFYLNTKRCYNNARDHIAKYLNYFETFYDGDQELLSVYGYIKLSMDTLPDMYPKEKFFYDLRRMILDPYSSLFRKVDQMNEENYCLRLTYKNNRNPALQYTDYHAKLMMRASVLMNLVIPLITHYMYVAKIIDAQSFILEIFTYILDNLCDGVRIINKLNETATTNILRHASNHAVLWEIQNIRSISPQTLTIGCVENIIVAIMPKYNYLQNIIHLNYKSILNGPKFQITDIPYEFTYVSLSSTKRDDDNNSEFDKYESFLAKENESDYLCIKANYQDIMMDLEMKWGPISSDEIDFYHRELSKGETYEMDDEGNVLIVQDEHSCIRDTQKNMIFLLFMKYFGNSYSLREINYIDYIKLVIIAKRMLRKAGLLILPDIIAGRFDVTKVKGINMKEKARMESSRLYEQVKKKYRSEDMMKLVLEMISKILASKFYIIDYDNEAINGKPIPMYNDILIDEILSYILMI